MKYAVICHAPLSWQCYEIQSLLRTVCGCGEAPWSYVNIQHYVIVSSLIDVLDQNTVLCDKPMVRLTRQRKAMLSI